MVKINTKRGLLRLWLAFSALWLPWHGYHAWEAYKSEKTWGGIASGYSEMFRSANSDPDTPYNNAQRMHYLDEFEKAAMERETSASNLEKHEYALFFPLALFAAYPLVLWLYRGFTQK